MKKPIVVRADSQPLRPLLLFGAVIAAFVSLFDILLAINSFMVCCTMYVPMFLGTHVVFGEKYFSICNGFVTSNLINYKNIKFIIEKQESKRFINRVINRESIVIQLHDDKEILLDITPFKAEDRKRIKELLLHKLDAAEEIYKQKCAASTCRMKLRG